VYNGDSDVFGSDAADDWLCLLEAFDQPHRPGMVRAAAATMFFGKTAESLAEGGDRQSSRQLWESIRSTAEIEWLKNEADRRLKQLDAFDQIDALQKILTTYNDRSGRCPANWKELQPIFRAIKLSVDPETGAPFDPSGTPFVFGDTNCSVRIHPESKIPVN